MTEQQAFVPPPWGMHADTLAAGNCILSLSSPGGGIVLVGYCSRNYVGALYMPHWRLWKLFTPVRFTDFLGVLQDAKISIPETDDAKIWLDACQAKAPVQSLVMH